MRPEPSARSQLRSSLFATPNTCGVYALRAALKIILGVGVRKIAAHTGELAERLCDGLPSRGYRLRSPRGRGEASAIVAFDHPRADLREIEGALLEAGVQAARRAGMIRAAVHVYNNEDDIDRLLDALPRP